MRRAGAWGLGVLLAVVALGCGRCGQRQADLAPVERVLPKGALAVAVVRDLDVVGARLRLLEQLKVARFIAPLQGFADAKAFTDAVAAQVGVDPRSPESLAAAGLDGARALGAAALVDGRVVVAVPVKDLAKLEATLTRLASQRLGASVAGTRVVNGVALKTLATPDGKVRVGWALAHGFALMATDASVEALSGLAVLSEADALVSDPTLKAQRARLPADPDAALFFPQGSPALAQAPFSSALVTVALTPTGLAAHLDGVWKGDPTQLAGLEPRPRPVDLLGLLPRDAFAVVRASGAPSSLAWVVPTVLGPHLTGALADAGVDPGPELLSHLRPGAVVSLSLADHPPLGGGLPTSLDPRRTNPTSYVHLVGAAALEPGTDGAAALRKLAALAPRFGARLKEEARGEVPVWVTTYAQGEGLHVALKGETVRVATPLGRLDAVVAAEPGGPAPVAGLGDEALAGVVDLHKLAAAVRALPDNAWGLGGFAIKATTVRWLDAVDDLLAVSFGVSARGGAVQGQLTLKLALGEAGRGAAAP